MAHFAWICLGGYCPSVFLPSLSQGTQDSANVPNQPGTTPAGYSDSSQVESRRLLGLIPNYRTSPSLQNYEPLTTGEKFKIASEDVFDRGTISLGTLFGAEAQLANTNRSFGQGGVGFGRYASASFADFAIGDYMSEAVFPTLLHQDPGYFGAGQEAAGAGSATLQGRSFGPIALPAG